jgi:hypothetical protein
VIAVMSYRGEELTVKELTNPGGEHTSGHRTSVAIKVLVPPLSSQECACRGRADKRMSSFRILLQVNRSRTPVAQLQRR